MRCDRGTTLATILVLLCCYGSAVGAVPLVTHRVFVANVATANPSGVVEARSASRDVDVDTVKPMHENDGVLHLHADIVEHHNLPPPSWQSVGA